MKKSLIATICVSFFLLTSTLSMSVSAADEYPLGLDERGDWSCAAAKNCSAIVGIPEENPMAIVAWTGVGNSWTNGLKIDFTSDAINRKILEDNDIRVIAPVALNCMSVGNCEGLVVGIGDDTQKQIGTLATRDTIKPYKVIYFLISQVDSIWQTPKHIETLSFTQKHALVAMTFHASIYCASHGNCVIAGNSGGPTEATIKPTGHVYGEAMLDTKPFFLSQVEGVWSSPQFPMVKKLQNRGAAFYTLKCSSLVECVIQGGYVPAPDVALKLKSQNNLKVAITKKSILSLGFTLTLANGMWGEPKTNLGPSYKKGSFPKGDPKVYVSDDPSYNYWNSRTNMMPCIKSENCRLGPITPLVNG